MVHKQLLKMQNSVESVLPLGPELGEIRKDTCPCVDVNEDALGERWENEPSGPLWVRRGGGDDAGQRWRQCWIVREFDF